MRAASCSTQLLKCLPLSCTPESFTASWGAILRGLDMVAAAICSSAKHCLRDEYGTVSEGHGAGVQQLPGFDQVLQHNRRPLSLRYISTSDRGNRSNAGKPGRAAPKASTGISFHRTKEAGRRSRPPPVLSPEDVKQTIQECSSLVMLSRLVLAWHRLLPPAELAHLLKRLLVLGEGQFASQKKHVHETIITLLASINHQRSACKPHTVAFALWAVARVHEATQQGLQSGSTSMKELPRPHRHITKQVQLLQNWVFEDSGTRVQALEPLNLVQLAVGMALLRRGHPEHWQRIKQRTLERLQAFSMSQLVAITWTFIRAEQTDVQLISAVADIVADKVGGGASVEAQHIASMAWYCARAGLGHPRLLRGISARYCQQGLDDFCPHDLSKLACALASSEHRDVALYRQISAYSMRSMHCFSAVDVTMMAAAYAQAGLVGDSLTASMAYRGQELLPSMSPHQLASLCLNLGMLGWGDRSFWAGAARTITRKLAKMEIPDMLKIMSGFVMTDQYDVAIFSEVAAACRWQSPHLTRAQLPIIAWALASVGHYDPDVMDIVGARSMRVSHTFDPNSLVRLLHSFARLRHPHELFLTKWTDLFFQLLDGFHSMQLCYVVWAGCVLMPRDRLLLGTALDGLASQLNLNAVPQSALASLHEALLALPVLTATAEHSCAAEHQHDVDSHPAHSRRLFAAATDRGHARGRRDATKAQHSIARVSGSERLPDECAQLRQGSSVGAAASVLGRELAGPSARARAGEVAATAMQPPAEVVDACRRAWFERVALEGDENVAAVREEVAHAMASLNLPVTRLAIIFPHGSPMPVASSAYMEEHLTSTRSLSYAPHDGHPGMPASHAMSPACPVTTAHLGGVLNHLEGTTAAADCHVGEVNGHSYPNEGLQPSQSSSESHDFAPTWQAINMALAGPLSPANSPTLLDDPSPDVNSARQDPSTSPPPFSTPGSSRSWDATSAHAVAWRVAQVPAPSLTSRLSPSLAHHSTSSSGQDRGSVFRQALQEGANLVVELALARPQARPIAIEVEGPDMFCSNLPSRRLAAGVIRRACLQAHGWDVLSIPTREWLEAPCDAGRVRYLRQRLAPLLGAAANSSETSS